MTLRRLMVAFLASSFVVSAHGANPDTVLKQGYEGCATPLSYCPDVDNDTWGDDGWCIVSCEKPYDFFDIPAGDCDNNSAAANPAGTEVCDGLDNDCENGVDDGNPGGGMACVTGLPGQCSAGTGACIGSSVMCVQNQGPSAEVCDGADNNCDSTIDEGNPGSGANCLTGERGECRFGFTQCIQGALTCPQIIFPEPEVCDGLDNNCNGLADEGLQGCTPP